MITIKAIPTHVKEKDEIGLAVESVVLVPDTDIPDTAVRVDCDGQHFHVYEAGE